MRSVIEAIELLRHLVASWHGLERLLSFWGPALDVPSWLAPAVALAGLLGLVLLSGISLASLGTLLTSMLFAALLLETVFGITLQIAPPTGR